MHDMPEKCTDACTMQCTYAADKVPRDPHRPHLGAQHKGERADVQPLWHVHDDPLQRHLAPEKLHVALLVLAVAKGSLHSNTTLQQCDDSTSQTIMHELQGFLVRTGWASLWAGMMAVGGRIQSALALFLTPQCSTTRSWMSVVNTMRVACSPSFCTTTSSSACWPSG